MHAGTFSMALLSTWIMCVFFLWGTKGFSRTALLVMNSAAKWSFAPCSRQSHGQCGAEQYITIMYCVRTLLDTKQIALTHRCRHNFPYNGNVIFRAELHFSCLCDWRLSILISYVGGMLCVLWHLNKTENCVMIDVVPTVHQSLSHSKYNAPSTYASAQSAAFLCQAVRYTQTLSSITCRSLVQNFTRIGP